MEDFHVAPPKFFFFFLSYDLMMPRLALNSQASDLQFLNARITGVCHHSQLLVSLSKATLGQRDTEGRLCDVTQQ